MTAKRDGSFPLHILGSHYCHTQVGGLTVYLTGPLPLPTPPSWSSSFFGWLLAPEPPPPPLFSGATLEVQRQQRMDQIERMMIHAYNNRQVWLQLAFSEHTVKLMF